MKRSKSIKKNLRKKRQMRKRFVRAARRRGGGGGGSQWLCICCCAPLIVLSFCGRSRFWGELSVYIGSRGTRGSESQTPRSWNDQHRKQTGALGFLLESRMRGFFFSPFVYIGFLSIPLSGLSNRRECGFQKLFFRLRSWYRAPSATFFGAPPVVSCVMGGSQLFRWLFS